MRKNFGAKPVLYPMPVMIIGTYDENGNANAMNAAWGGIVGGKEIIISLGSHKTTENMKKTNAFTVSMADVAHTAECDYVGIVSANDDGDKMKKAGFTCVKSEFVNAPVINELPLTLECKLKSILDGGLYVGEIVNISADENILGDDGEVDIDKFKPITFDPIHDGYYELGAKVGTAFSDGKKLK